MPELVVESIGHCADSFLGQLLAFAEKSLWRVNLCMKRILAAIRVGAVFAKAVLSASASRLIK